MIRNTLIISVTGYITYVCYDYIRVVVDVVNNVVEFFS
jgi:hypothetical protein